jgi:hypothetical protein
LLVKEGLPLTLGITAIIFVIVMIVFRWKAKRAGSSVWQWFERGSWVAGIISAIFAIALVVSTTQDKPAQIIGIPTAADSPDRPAANTTTVAPTTTTTTTTVAPTTSSSNPVPVKLSPGVCGIGVDSFLDFDEPWSFVEDTTTPPEDEAEFELLYRNCSGELENHKAISFGTARDVAPTADACRSTARTQSVGRLPLAEITPGLVLCVVTTERRIGWAQVTAVGCPCEEADDRDIPTIDLSIISWP